ncbi:bestrophin family protein [Hymenobacter terricola]|uniref:bestrophin family protein n=1 Tax=Hymenobacter terricola TaxID=2819236 RepID=UPI001B314739|nr:bestrophin family ion channel [Hymenobacter terricola]
MLLDTRLPVRYVFKHLRPDVIRVLLISLCFQTLKRVFPAQLPLIPLPLVTILGSSISLLLAFKISQSYDRWWEARKLWGAIANDSRTLVLQLRGFVRDEVLHQPGPAAPLPAMAYRQMAWCYSLGQSLRGLPAAAGLQNYLSTTELAYLQQPANKPLALLALHTGQVKALFEAQAINAFQQVQLDATLMRLGDAMGGAERIKSTVFPTSYRLMVYSSIYLFLIMLSLGLIETIGGWETPVLLAVASTFFLLERTARYLQDPFSNKPTDTPVTAIARAVETDLRQLLQEAPAPAPMPAGGFYLM